MSSADSTWSAMTDEERAAVVEGEEDEKFNPVARLCPSCRSRKTRATRTVGRYTYCACDRCRYTYKRPSIAGATKQLAESSNAGT